MPKERFQSPDGGTGFNISWGDQTGVDVAGVNITYAEADRLANILRRATGKDRTVTVTLTAQTDEYVSGMQTAVKVTKQLAEAAAELRATGISPTDLPDAVRTALNLAETVVCCEVCDKPTIRIPGEFTYEDPQGIITARCASHAN